MPIRFPRENNPWWPLPPDYPSLTGKGQRSARLNACFMQETPEDYVGAWSFFRSYYLFPPATPIGLFYKHGVLPSPPAHYQIVRNMGTFQLNAIAAPRSFAKSTLLREVDLMEVLTRDHWEIVLFLAKDSFVAEQLDIYKSMIEHNERICNDFQWYWGEKTGKASLKPRRGQGLWSNHVIKMTNGSSILGLPIMGAALGKRPHRIRFDDVERDKSLVKEPAEQVEAFRNMLMNVVYPMAEEGCGIDIMGTLLSRRSFLFWLMDTQDPRIVENWARVRLPVKLNGANIWEEKMGDEWQSRQKSTMGVAAFNTQYMNEPATEHERVLRIHEQLNTYLVEDLDSHYQEDPPASQAVCVSCTLTGYQDGNQGLPTYAKVTRPFGQALGHMYRFITVDSASTVSSHSDRSCIHVMGIENSKDYRDTLWSLDLYSGHIRQHELVQRIFQMAVKWQVRVVGIEAYGPQVELFERIQVDLPNLFGFGAGIIPPVIPIKFPPSMEKPDKIRGLEWRFNQYRVKLPWHRRNEPAYSRLFDQIENFTDDLALLATDDEIDTLSMQQAIGKPRKHGGPDVGPAAPDLFEQLRAGRTHDQYGIPILAGIGINDIPPDVLDDVLHRQRTSRARRLRWIQVP